MYFYVLDGSNGLSVGGTAAEGPPKNEYALIISSVVACGAHLFQPLFLMEKWIWMCLIEQVMFEKMMNSE